MERILVINPGATSTKIAVFDGSEPILKQTVEHHGDELQGFARVADQYPYRRDLILNVLTNAGIAFDSLNAIVGRGGLLMPLTGGTYKVNQHMVEDLKTAVRGEHASNLGGVLAYGLAEKSGVPAFIVDPVSVDELDPVARISGSPDIDRVSMSHALNMKAVARKVASEMGKKYPELNLIVVHLGTGVTLSAHRGGRMIEICDGKEEGPFAPDRCGGLPASQLVKLCFSGKYTYDELRTRLFGNGGFYAYLGTKDMREVERRADEGDAQAELLLQAFTYQIAREIGAMSTVLEGNVNRIVITGGIAYSTRIIKDITKRVKHIAAISVVPGEEELEALAAGALRVLRGEEEAQTYL